MYGLQGLILWPTSTNVKISGFQPLLSYTMKFLVTFSAALLVAFQAHCAPASAESVEALLALTNQEATVEAMYASVEQSMRSGMVQAVTASSGGQAPSPRMQKFLDTTSAKFMELLREDLSWAKMKPEIVALYQEVLEQEDVDGQIAFYQSRAGKSFVQKMPLIMQKSMGMGQKMMLPMMPKLTKFMEQAVADAKAMR
jgi:uncharacterized protein